MIARSRRRLERGFAQSGRTQAGHSAHTRGQPVSSLPLPRTSLIGREQEIAEVGELLCRGGNELITLTGAGGCGKTRLALELARLARDHFRDGVLFVDLAAITDSTLVLPTVGRMLSLPERPRQSHLDTLIQSLRSRQLLLVLDNFEQVRDAAPLLVELLSACPRLQALVTSRAVLRVRGEREYMVAPLAQCPAVELFLARSRDARAGVPIADEHAPAVAEICRRLDGLPLAIELAAARSRLLPPPALLARLVSALGGLGLLTDGPRDLPLRQRTLRATIAWSYDLLDDAERRTFARLAVFSGGATLDACEAVIGTVNGGPRAADVLDLVTALVENSLLRVEELSDGGAPLPAGPSALVSIGPVETVSRLRMLETIREYALERLEESGEEDALRTEHASYYLALAEQAGAGVRGPDQQCWLARLTADQENCRAALAHARAARNAEQGLRLCNALRPFWEIYGNVAEGRRWYEAFLGDRGRVPPGVLAAAIFSAGKLARHQGEYATARALTEESLELWSEMDDQLGVAEALGSLAAIVRFGGDYALARSLYEECLAVLGPDGDPHALSYAFNLYGQLMVDTGDPEAARRLQEQSLALRRRIGNSSAIAVALSDLGTALRGLEDYSGARACFEEALRLQRALNEKRQIAISCTALAAVARHDGQTAEALALLRESLVLKHEMGELRGIAFSLEGTARVTLDLGQMERAALLLAAAERLREDIGAPMSPGDLARFEQETKAIAGALGDSALAETWATGRAMMVEDAITTALMDVQPAAATPNGELPAPATLDEAIAEPVVVRHTAPMAALPDGLTVREGEVLRLLATGLTNAEIGDRLVLSAGTVKRHAENIYAKIGAHRRTDVTAYALRHGLLHP
jgi:predicted ATPase/DNA-binding CsgD family transcriptional regulator